MYRRFPGAVDHGMDGLLCRGFLLFDDTCHVIDLGLTVYVVKRPIGRAAITCGDDLKGIGDMPQQAV